MGLFADPPASACGGSRSDNGEWPTDCGDVMKDVWLFLDDELDPQRRAVVQQHLDDCSPCLDQAGLDIKLKRLLARKCGGERAPEQLRNRIVTQLVSFGGETRATSVTHTSVTRRSIADGTASITHTSVTRSSFTRQAATDRDIER